MATTTWLPEDLLKHAKKAAIDAKTSLQQMLEDGLRLRLREMGFTPDVSAEKPQNGSAPRKAKG